MLKLDHLDLDRRLTAGAPLKLGAHVPLSGPMTVFADVGLTARAVLEEASRGGGVHGHAVQLVLRDDGYLADRTEAVVNELFTTHGVLGLFLGTGTLGHARVFQALRQAGVPDLAYVSGATAFAALPLANGFAANATYSAMSEYFGAHALRRAPQGPALVVTYDAFGPDWLPGFRRGYGENVQSCFIGPNATCDADIELWAQRLAAEKPATVCLFVRPEHTAALLTRLRASQPTCHFYVAFLETLWDLCGDALEGTFGVHWLKMPEGSNDAAIEAHRRFMAQHLPATPVSPLSVGGHAAADLLLELLRRAGPRPSQRAIVDSIATFDGSWRSPLAYVAPRASAADSLVYRDFQLLVARDRGWQAAE